MGDAFHDLVSLDLLEVNEITRIKMSCSTINAPCDHTTAEIQQVQSEIGASPPGRATCNHGMLLQEDHFPLTRLGTRIKIELRTVVELSLQTRDRRHRQTLSVTPVTVRFKYMCVLAPPLAPCHVLGRNTLPRRVASRRRRRR